MKKKLQVFISSTFTDMLLERQAAVEAVLRAGHIPAGMELFAAGNESQLEIIHRWIDDSDVFMLILGGRYGSIEPKSGKSYIELEYRYATEKRKPFFAVIISDDYLATKVKENGASFIETQNSNQLKEFRDHVSSKICRFFKDVSELKLNVFESLANLERLENLSGWLKGSEVIDPKATLEELSRIQADNTELRRKFAELEVVAKLSIKTDSFDSVPKRLSEDARTLLVTAKNGGGQIMFLRFIGGAMIQAANKNFLENYSKREEARWKGAIDELRGHRLIEDMNSKGETFQLTKLGYEIADEIDKKK